MNETLWHVYAIKGNDIDNLLKVSKSIESLDESNRGSVIIHEDIDDEYI